MLARRGRRSGRCRERAWEHFIPFLEFSPNLRKIIYTTNAIESFNYQLRKIIKNRGHFPNDEAVVKLLWLAIADIGDKRARARAKERGKPRDQRTAAGKLIEGQATQGWRPALSELATAYPGRIPTWRGRRGRMQAMTGPSCRDLEVELTALAGPPITVHTIDVDDLIDIVERAAAAIGALAREAEAEALGGHGQDLDELAMDLQIAAAELAELTEHAGE